MRTCVALLSLLISLTAPAVSQTKDPFPTVAVMDLLERKGEFPALAHGRTVALVIGFTHASQSQTKEWGQRIGKDLETYQMAVLEDVPRLVRGMVTGGIKGSVPEARRDHFLLVFTGEKELKQAAGFERPDDAYVILLDREGRIRWRMHGPVSEAALGELKTRFAGVDAER